MKVTFIAIVTLLSSHYILSSAVLSSFLFNFLSCDFHMHGCSSPLGQVLFFKLRVIRANTQVEVADLTVLGVLTNLIIKTIQVLSSTQGQTEMLDTRKIFF